VGPLTKPPPRSATSRGDTGAPGPPVREPGPLVWEPGPPAWEPGPCRPRLREGAVHVWCAELDSVPEELATLLAADELARADRILDKFKAQRWGRARAVLRELLGRYLRVDPRTLRFAIEPSGRPALVGVPVATSAATSRGPDAVGLPNPARHCFNVSHSGRFALYALATTRSVGVDVELARRSLDHVAVAARAFGSEAAHELQQLGPGEREQQFLQSWTRREAILKCGRAIGADGEPEPLSSEPWVTALPVGPRAAAAVAVSERPSELLCWRWVPAHVTPESAPCVEASSAAATTC
jgi:4'-phosphopantetheinyl transferase